MTHDEMFRNALQRPTDYHKLSHEVQWSIDKQLGLLDWEGPKTDDEWNRLRDHHGQSRGQVSVLSLT